MRWVSARKENYRGIYEEKVKNDSNSKSLANLINILKKTVFGDDNRFIFELIQNADDSPKTPEVEDVEVELRLLKNHLIFSYNGKHFTEDDVKGMSDVGSGTYYAINIGGKHEQRQFEGL